MEVTVEIFKSVLLVGCIIHVTHGYTNISDIDRLIKDKRTDYNVYLRPKFNQSEPLVISMAFDLIAIRDFDEVAEKFSVVGTVYMIWKDDRMTWDAEEYGDLYSFIIEHNDFWTPPFILVNAFEKFEKVGKDDYWTIRFYHNGYVLYHPGQVFTTTCTVNVKLYPWDIQTCDLLFTVWGYMPKEVVLTPFDGNDKVSLTYFSDNGEWDLVDTRAGEIGHNLFQFQFKMKRKPLFIVVNTLIPIILMSLLNIMGFLIPIESGERVSYCITVLLAIAVFLTLIGDTMPRSATTIAVLCYYLVCVLGLSMLIILAAIISMRFYLKSESEEIPPCWKAVVRLIRCMTCQRPSQKSRRDRRTISGSDELERSDYIIYRGKGRMDPFLELQRNDLSIVSEVAQPLGSKRPNVQSENLNKSHKTNGHVGMNDFIGIAQENYHDDIGITWKDVSCTVDIVCGTLAILCLLIFTSYFFIYTIVSSNTEEN